MPDRKAYKIERVLFLYKPTSQPMGWLADSETMDSAPYNFSRYSRYLR
jgi:hypothetical protein